MATKNVQTRTCDTCPDEENEIPLGAKFFSVQRLYDDAGVRGGRALTYGASKELHLCEKCATGLGLADLVQPE
jgi:hypothetical protein